MSSSEIQHELWHKAQIIKQHLAVLINYSGTPDSFKTMLRDLYNVYDIEHQQGDFLRDLTGTLIIFHEETHDIDYPFSEYIRRLRYAVDCLIRLYSNWHEMKIWLEGADEALEELPDA